MKENLLVTLTLWSCLKFVVQLYASITVVSTVGVDGTQLEHRAAGGIKFIPAFLPRICLISTPSQLILQDEQAALSPHTQNTGGEVVKPPASVTLTFLIFQNPLTDKISESQFSHMQILLGL